MSWDWFHLGFPKALSWLWLLVPLALLFVYDLRRKRRVLQLFVEQSLLDDVSPRRSVARPVVKFLIFAAGMTSLVIALARPQWDPQQIELQQQGQNLLFCLDVSKSMLARDVDPSRLEAAKASIRELIDKLPAGNQVGLVAYAGNAELACPLTPNYRHLLSVLDRIDCNSVDEPGTNFGDAISMVTRQVFGLEPSAASQPSPDVAATRPATRIEPERHDNENLANVLIAFTDGENHEGHARDMARQASDLGVGIYIMGLGTTDGARIPIEDNDHKTTYLMHKGQPVITKYDDASLRAVVEGLDPQRSGYLAAGASNVDLVDIYRNVIARQGTMNKTFLHTIWEEKFQLFVAVGLFLVLLSYVISEQKPMGRKGGQS